MGTVISGCLDVSCFDLKSPSIILAVYKKKKENRKINMEELFLMWFICYNNIGDVCIRTNE